MYRVGIREKRLASKKDRKIIFSNIKMIYEFHEKLLEDLKAFMETSHLPEGTQKKTKRTFAGIFIFFLLCCI